MFYAGIGSRKTPDSVLRLMEKCAARLRDLGWTLRSGCAEGADSAFERGAEDQAELFIPWSGFRGRQPECYDGPLVMLPSPGAFELAAQTHPAWGRCSRGARALHARNCHQILGPDLESPSVFVVCWTPDGAEEARQITAATGGTGQALRLACRRGVPVFNMKQESALLRLRELLLSRAP
jgi:hypothetical protein